MRLVYNIDFEPKRSLLKDLIILSDKDLKGIQMPYNDLIVVLVVFANYKDQKIMVDSGNATYILFIRYS